MPEPGAFYVMDRGYIDFERLARLDNAGSFFVTRAKSNLKAERRYSHPVDRCTGFVCDQTVVLTGFYSRQGLRHAAAAHQVQGSRDRQTTGVSLQQFRAARHDHRQALPTTAGRSSCSSNGSSSICGSRRSSAPPRMRSKRKSGSLSAVYVLVAIVKKRLALQASLYEILQILSLTMFEKTPVDSLFDDDASQKIPAADANQLNLFN